MDTLSSAKILNKHKISHKGLLTFYQYHLSVNTIVYPFYKVISFFAVDSLVTPT